jgi:hypothetical protein
MLDLAFRDETTTVVQKHGKVGEQSKESNTSDSALSFLQICLPQSVQQPVSDVALCHFLNSYAVTGSPFNYLHKIIGKVPMTAPLLSSTIATALANLSRERQQPELMQTALMFHGKALKQTQMALQSRNVKSDSTLASIMVLGLFDVMALDGETSTATWDTHVEGTVSLLKVQGEELLETHVGLEMYIQASNNIRVSCVQRGVPLPQAFVELDKKAVTYLDANNPIIRFWLIVDAFVELQVMVRNRYQYEATDLIRKSLEIDKMAVVLADSLESPWLYQIIAPEDAPPDAFRQTAHQYSDYAVSRFWNTIRMTRIFVNEVIWDESQVMKTQSEEDPQFWDRMQIRALINADKMAIDILASVPQFIQVSMSETSPLQATMVSGFVWPLSAVGRSKLLAADVREYAIRSLYKIGKDAKLRQAVRIAESLENGATSLTW